MDKNKIIEIEKDKLKKLQSGMDTLINHLNINELSKEILIDLVFLNNEFNNLVSSIEDIKIKLLKKDNNISEQNLIRLKNYDHNNNIIKKYLPFMLLECINN